MGTYLGRFTRIVVALAAFLLAALTGAAAAPVAYLLDLETTEVSFTYRAQGAEATGKIPVATSKVALDVTRLEGSTFEVELDATRGTAGFPFADQAMRGSQMLDAQSHPRIGFVSQKIVVGETEAEVTGALTIRGQSHPVTLQAEIFRQPGTEAGSLDNLAIVLTGVIDRHIWGVSGFRDLVAPEIDLEIRAFISRAP